MNQIDIFPPYFPKIHSNIILRSAPEFAEWFLNIFSCADLNGCTVWSTYYLRPLEHWDRGFESRSGHGCVSPLFWVVLSCASSGLATGRSPVRGVLPTVQKYIHKFEKSNSESEEARAPNPNLLHFFMHFSFTHSCYMQRPFHPS
jgi:hypothetical protein